MTKYLCFFIVTCFIACGATLVRNNKAEESRKNDNDKILWSANRKLTWNDFKGKNHGSFDSRKAETSVIIMTDSVYYDHEKLPVYKIGCYFVIEDSWTITSEDFALDHEQIHFDIGEVFTRKIRKSFDSLRQKKIKEFDSYQVLFEELNEDCRLFNIKYDSEVYQVGPDGIVVFNKEKQREWKTAIAGKLENLKKYEPR